MNIYISKANEEWLRLQGTSMSGIVNRLLDEARAGKHGLHVLKRYDSLEEAQESHNIRPDIPRVVTKGPNTDDVSYTPPEDAA